MFQVNSMFQHLHKPEKLSITFKDNFYWKKENMKNQLKHNMGQEIIFPM